MEIGKLSNEDLENLVLKKIPKPQSTLVKSGAGVGIDSAVLDLGEKLLVVSSDPITAGGDVSGSLSIYVSCNDIAAGGATPSFVLLVLLAPPSSTKEEIEGAIDQAVAAAKNIGVDIVGGHTEVTDAVRRMVITTTAFGIRDSAKPFLLGKALPGDTLLMTKSAGIEGSLIAIDAKKDILEKNLSVDEIQEVNSFFSSLSIVEDGAAALLSMDSDKKEDLPSLHLMHDITEGGVYGAAYEMAALSGIGVTLYPNQIPVAPVTRKITDIFSINPMRFISSGSLLMASSDPEAVEKQMNRKNIPCTRIGEFQKDGFFLCENGEKEILSPPAADEVYKL